MRASPFEMRTDVLSWGRTTREPQRVAAPRFRDELQDLIGDVGDATKLAIGMRRPMATVVSMAPARSSICAVSTGSCVSNPKPAFCARRRGSAFRIFCVLWSREGGFCQLRPGHVSSPSAARSPMTYMEKTITVPDLSADMCAASVFCAATVADRSSRQKATQNYSPRPSAGLVLPGSSNGLRFNSLESVVLIDVETVPFARLDDFWTLMEESEPAFEHTVAWIDCTSRGDKRGRGFSPGPIGFPTAHMTSTTTVPGSVSD